MIANLTFFFFFMRGNPHGLPPSRERRRGVPDSYRLKPPRCLLARERGAAGVQIHPQPLTSAVPGLSGPRLLRGLMRCANPCIVSEARACDMGLSNRARGLPQVPRPWTHSWGPEKGVVRPSPASCAPSAAGEGNKDLPLPFYSFLLRHYVLRPL